MDKKWTMVFLSNGPFIKKAFDTIYLARTTGEWKDDIVLLLSADLYNDDGVKQQCKLLDVIMREVPNRNFDSVLNVWKKHPEHPEYEYVINRGFMYNKFLVFDTFFKQWDYVFYLDSGAKIQGPLERMKKACTPDKCIYAHSDSYPTYLWKLKRQFSLELFDNETNKQRFYESYYPYFEHDYFQGTIFIYDTSIIDENTVNRLFWLSEMYPIAIRMDQGILNLHFHCERCLWKQIPLKDDIGFLYDFFERERGSRSKYLILKYQQFS
jgi:lipopolysaccharide biosynthesis glycosyltransferase